MYERLECSTPIVKTYGSGLGNKRIVFIGGTHGDEPAGAYAIQNYNFYNSKYEITTIIVNPCGVEKNTRINPYTNKDMNRFYGKNDDINKKIEGIIKDSDLIIDFHEGYDFHLINKNSIGSTLSTETAIPLATDLINHLNSSIDDKQKYFSVITDKEEIKGSLRDYSEDRNYTYILVETTRKYNIDVRVAQCSQIINYVLSK
jgi:predicted deacylase